MHLLHPWQAPDAMDVTDAPMGDKAEAEALKASLDKRALSRLEHGTVIVKHASRKRFIARRGQTLFRQATDE